jgi:hypothetical protein
MFSIAKAIAGLALPDPCIGNTIESLTIEIRGAAGL